MGAGAGGEAAFLSFLEGSCRVTTAWVVACHRPHPVPYSVGLLKSLSCLLFCLSQQMRAQQAFGAAGMLHFPMASTKMSLPSSLQCVFVSWASAPQEQMTSWSLQKVRIFFVLGSFAPGLHKGLYHLQRCFASFGS